jgi:hypothetical protein
VADADAILRGKVTMDTSELDRTIGRAAAFGSAVGTAVGNLVSFGVMKAKDLVVGFIGGAITGARDLAETTSKVGVLFGQSTQKIIDWSKGAARGLGQSKQEALDSAATFAVFGKSAGLSGDALVKFSEQNTKLASDMASFANTSPQDAIEAIGSALRGESEPIRKYGVLLDEASLRNEALRLGLISTTKQALTPQQRVLAAQAAIMRQTTAAQGDFARTSGGLANQQRILHARIQDLKAGIGERLLPVVLAIVSALNSNLGPALHAIGAVFSGVIGFVRSYGDAILAVVAVVGTAAVVFRGHAIAVALYEAVQKAAAIASKVFAAAQWLLNAALTANPIGLIVLAIVALVAAFVLAYRHSETFRRIVQGAWSGIKEAVGASIAFIRAVVNGLVEHLRGPVTTYFHVMRAVWSVVFSTVGATITVVMAVIRFAVNSVVAFIRTVVVPYLHVMGAVWGAIFRTVGAVVSGAMALVRGVISGAIGFVVSVWHSGLGRLVSGAISTLGQVVSWFAGLGGRIVGAISGIASRLWSAGANIVSSFASGIRSMAGSIVSAIADTITSALPGFVKKALGIGSPSRVFHDLGRQTALGFAQGISAGRDDVAGAMGQLLALPGTPSLAAAIGGLGGLARTAGGAFPTPSSTTTNLSVAATMTNADPQAIADEIAWQLRTGAVA